MVFFIKIFELINYVELNFLIMLSFYDEEVFLRFLVYFSRGIHYLI